MDQPVLLAQHAATFALHNAPLSIEALKRFMSPLASSSVNNVGILGIGSQLSSSMVDSILTKSQLTSYDGVLFWLALMRSLRDEDGFDLLSFHSLTTFRTIISRKYEQFLTLGEALIPSVQRSSYEGVPQIQMVPYSEYIELHGLLDMSQFFIDLMQIILFGFPITFSTPDLLDVTLEDLLSYVQFRVKQGYFDGHLRHFKPSTSTFDDAFETDPNVELLERSNDQFLLDASTLSSEDEYLQLLDKHKSSLFPLFSKVPHFGRATETVKALARNDLFDARDKQYLDKYLRQTRLPPGTFAYAPAMYNNNIQVNNPRPLVRNTPDMYNVQVYDRATGQIQQVAQTGGPGQLPRARGVYGVDLSFDKFVF